MGVIFCDVVVQALFLLSYYCHRVRDAINRHKDIQTWYIPDSFPKSFDPCILRFVSIRVNNYLYIYLYYLLVLRHLASPAHGFIILLYLFRVGLTRHWLSSLSSITCLVENSQFVVCFFYKCRLTCSSVVFERFKLLLIIFLTNIFKVTNVLSFPMFVQNTC